MIAKNKCRVGTRSSQLALWQTHHVIEALQAHFPETEFEVVEMSTKGDRILDQALSAIGDKGLFTRDLEEAMHSGAIDFAVHSLKDMPSVLPDGLGLTAMLKREDPRDALLAKNNVKRVEDLPAKAIVGTSSLRRKAQLLSKRPDLDVRDLRGNVQTRVRKFEEGPFDAAILAGAGLHRMAMEDYISDYLPLDHFIPAVGQGIVVVESRLDDELMLEMLAQINDKEAQTCSAAERAFMRRLEGGCQVPIGALASIEGEGLSLRGFLGRVDGSEAIIKEKQGAVAEAETLGQALAEDMLAGSGQAILNDIRKG
ncbi:hydroxymethylbilane synthase [Peptococcus simiae]|uniref:Porphobilinogen deaminase n=1 Tax=Peptococcus simiae TaxID=1643805 RepID=A0ABW9GY11_9FIRM